MEGKETGKPYRFYPASLIAREVRKFTTKISEKTFNVVIPDSPGSIVIEGITHKAELKQISRNVYSLILDSLSYELWMRPEGDRVRVLVEGREYEVLLGNRNTPQKRRSGRVQAIGKSTLEIRAPMPGLVTGVKVKPGSQVEEGSGLVLLEAMKMENEIRSPKSGVVVDILASSGSAVEKGDVLVRLAT